MGVLSGPASANFVGPCTGAQTTRGEAASGAAAGDRPEEDVVEDGVAEVGVDGRSRQADAAKSASRTSPHRMRLCLRPAEKRQFGGGGGASSLGRSPGPMGA